MVDISGSGYDPNKVEAKGFGFDPLPAGKYKMAIMESDLKSSQNNPNSQYLAFTFQVTEGPYAGRKVFQNVTWKNEKIDAVKIGMGQLATIQKAAGVQGAITDTGVLHFKPMMVEVGLKKRKDTGEDQNVIKGIESAASAPPPSTEGEEKPPWEQ